VNERVTKAEEIAHLVSDNLPRVRVVGIQKENVLIELHVDNGLANVRSCGANTAKNKFCVTNVGGVALEEALERVNRIESSRFNFERAGLEKNEVGFGKFESLSQSDALGSVEFSVELF
jgi:hypothetical protein